MLCVAQNHRLQAHCHCCLTWIFLCEMEHEGQSVQHVIENNRVSSIENYSAGHTSKFEWRLFIFISRESKWGTLKSAGNPRCAVPAESRSICTDQRRPGPAAALKVSPTSDTCQSVAILMNRPHLRFATRVTLDKLSANGSQCGRTRILLKVHCHAIQ